MLRKELQLFTFKDVLEYFPLRHIDKTIVTPINAIPPNTDYVQCAGIITYTEIIGEKAAKRLVAQLKDNTGTLELTWFKSISWAQKLLAVGNPYLVYGKLTFFNGKAQIVHPEIEAYTLEKSDGKSFLEPIYPSTEKLKARGLTGRQLGKITAALINQLSPKDIPENIPDEILQRLKLVDRYSAYTYIHTPPNPAAYDAAVRRLKFEEFFIAQTRLLLKKIDRHRSSSGVIFEKVGNFFTEFYNNYLPFELTNAQKKVLKEIRKDTANGRQMNRLLQGDVGSGKTIVALLSMLIAAGNNFQSCIMAPTEILANQHYEGITKLLNGLPIEVALLTGSTKTAERRRIFEALANGQIKLLIGTHAIIEDKVVFQNLGLAIVDEQHRFGVAQRGQLWKKATIPPHILVMTATPIPRTLAMTAYGDLDTSIMNELPPGRKPILTTHRHEGQRGLVMEFVKEEIAAGRQIYIVYPLIEESEKMAYEDLTQGIQIVQSYLPEPKYWLSVLHGRMPAAQKETNMQRFVNKDTQIMISTTVIEVGVNVPNASVMIIESAEKFGLSQLHQLRGRVGRGSEKSYCILLTGDKLGKEAKKRIETMCATNDGFKIAETDLEIRGPGDIEGTRQSGELNFKIANIVEDKAILEVAKQYAEYILNEDNDLTLPKNSCLKQFLLSQKGKTLWSKIS